MVICKYCGEKASLFSDYHYKCHKKLSKQEKIKGVNYERDWKM